MKITHLSTYGGYGEVGSTVLRLDQSLKSSGVESAVVCLHHTGHSTSANVISSGLFGRIGSKFNIFAERFFSKILTRKSSAPFSLQWFGRSAIHHPAVRHADVIHLHWVNDGFLSPKFLAQIDELEKPVVWTFYDSNAFTGGCHDHQNCENYHKECGFCPLLKISGKNDLSHKTWARKKRAYSELNCHIIAADKLMADAVKLSSLMGFREVAIIPRSMSKVFKPYLKPDAKKILRINSDKFVLMTSFTLLMNDLFRGAFNLIDALNDLAARPGIDQSNFELVILGSKLGETLPEFPFKTTFLGSVSNDEHLSKCYSAADVFIVPSLQDRLEDGVMESLSCATPVVAFETVGTLQVVRHLENGYLAEYGSMEDLATGIEWLYHDENAPDIQKEARRTILTQFSEGVIAEKHLLLYQSLIDLQPK
ncbi:glycosyltransferase [Pedobacter nyackensis]|uniref:glycosyltransferase n=1 Tax=Pedobacter nyackensis TaxID=475255 RepID=UPI002930848F|nr:glycosyltransferase [Pedobacter nyackensis]